MSVVEDGEQTEAVVSFETAEGIRRLLTEHRLELLRSLMGAPAGSITDLAERLDRSYAVVHDDVEILAEYGIVKFRQDGSIQTALRVLRNYRVRHNRPRAGRRPRYRSPRVTGLSRVNPGGPHWITVQ